MEHPTLEELSGHLIDPASAPEVGLHLQGCQSCQLELDALGQTKQQIAGTGSLKFSTPPFRIWAAIDGAISDDQSGVKEPGPTSPRSRWLLRTSHFLQIAAVSALIGLLGGWLLWGQQGSPPAQPQQTVLASTTLQDQDTQQQRGQAKLIDHDGELTLTITIQDGHSPEVLTVWLSNPQTNERIQVGLIDQSRSTSTFSIPRHLVNDGFKMITLSRGANQREGATPTENIATGRLEDRPTDSASNKPTKPVPTTATPASSPKPSLPAANSTPRGTPSTAPTPSPSSSATPTPSHSAKPKPSRTPKPTPTRDPARKRLRQQAKACRTLLSTPRTGTATDREQRVACRQLLREWRAQRATPLPQPRSVNPDQLQPEVLPQPSQT